jgi:hypothetical protein
MDGEASVEDVMLAYDPDYVKLTSTNDMPLSLEPEFVRSEAAVGATPKAAPPRVGITTPGVDASTDADDYYTDFSSQLEEFVKTYAVRGGAEALAAMVLPYDSAYDSDSGGEEDTVRTANGGDDGDVGNGDAADDGDDGNDDGDADDGGGGTGDAVGDAAGDDLTITNLFIEQKTVPTFGGGLIAGTADPHQSALRQIASGMRPNNIRRPPSRPAPRAGGAVSGIGSSVESEAALDAESDVGSADVSLTEYWHERSEVAGGDMAEDESEERTYYELGSAPARSTAPIASR